MTFTATLCTLPKLERAPHENEDSLAADLRAKRFAMSDGASTAARSEVWSRLLVNSFITGDDPLDTAALATLREQWWNEVFRDDLPWFAVDKLAGGSAATFLGLQLHDGHYEVTAVGDTCLFHLRAGDIVLAAPLDDAALFGRFPDLVSTHHPVTAVWSGGGEFRSGDLFVLATDAVAEHLLTARALDAWCGSVVSPERFEEFVASERRCGLANDDSSVCVVRT